MPDEEVKQLRAQVREDRKLIQRAAETLAEIHRGAGLTDEHADVLAALRIRLEGKERASLEDLLTAMGELAGKKDLAEVLDAPLKEDGPDWPVVPDKKKEWPGL